jgi:hypothetical protein
MSSLKKRKISNNLTLCLEPIKSQKKEGKNKDQSKNNEDRKITENINESKELDFWKDFF